MRHFIYDLRKNQLEAVQKVFQYLEAIAEGDCYSKKVGKLTLEGYTYEHYGRSPVDRISSRLLHIPRR